MRTRTSSRRSAAALTAGALLLSFAGTVGVASAASANGETPAPSLANINESTPRSLTLHKYEESASSEKKGSTSEKTDLGLKPLKDAGFTVYKVNGIDLKDSAGWDKANELATALNGAGGGACAIPGSVSGVTLGAASTEQFTDANGDTTFAGLDFAAYVVCETTLPAGVVTGSLPFLVTLPLSGTGSQAPWIYDVHAYPKNSSSSVTKDVLAPSGILAGSTVDFVVKSDIPVVTAPKVLSEYSLSDTVDSRLTDVKVVSVKINGSPVVFTDNTSGNAVKIDFVGTQLGAVKAAGGKQIEVVISAQVNGGSAEDLGIIRNTANVTLTAGGKTTTIPSNEVTTNWGGFTLLKHVTGDKSSTLAGAEFSVFKGVKGEDDTCTAAKDGAAIITGLTTAADGTASVPALFIGNTTRDNTGAIVEAETVGCFVLEETKAPAGYALDSTPQAIQVEADSNELVYQNIAFANVKKTSGELPLTGAAGQVLLTLGGVAAVAIAGGLMLVRRRNQAEAR